MTLAVWLANRLRSNSKTSCCACVCVCVCNVQISWVYEFNGLYVWNGWIETSLNKEAFAVVIEHDRSQSTTKPCLNDSRKTLDCFSHFISINSTVYHCLVTSERRTLFKTSLLSIRNGSTKETLCAFTQRYEISSCIKCEQILTDSKSQVVHSLWHRKEWSVEMMLEYAAALAAAVVDPTISMSSVSTS
jgi:hypothetical protein